MSTPVRTVTVPVPPPNEREIRRYAGCPEGADELLAVCLAEMQGLNYRVCYRECAVTDTDKGLDLEFAVTRSADLCKALGGCSKVLLFAATVGQIPDRLIARYERLSPAKALWIQAIGAERVEALCDAFCRQQTAAGVPLCPRFSPGYGDLPLTFQKAVFAALDCPRQLGITLNDSLLMVPSKSVTALAGIRTNGEEAAL